MKSLAMDISKMQLVRLDPGEDVLISLRKVLRENDIKQGVILGGYGTLAKYHLHWVKHNKLPSDNLFRKGEGGIEILAMNGVIVDYEPHIHVALSTPDGAFGGHLEEGCEVYVLCEIYVGEAAGKTLSRQTRAVDIPGMGKGEVTALEF